MQDRKNEKIILSLIRLALGQKNVHTFPDYADWDKVMSLMQNQGVRALLNEALEAIKQNNIDIKTFPLRMQIMQSYAQTVQVEKMYLRHLALAISIA